MAVDVDLHEHRRAEKLALFQQRFNGLGAVHPLGLRAKPVIEVIEGLGHLAHAVVFGLLHRRREADVLLEDPPVIVLVVVLDLRHDARHPLVRLKDQPIL